MHMFLGQLDHFECEGPKMRYCWSVWGPLDLYLAILMGPCGTRVELGMPGTSLNPCTIFLVPSFIFVVLGIELQGSPTRGRHSTTEPSPWPGIVHLINTGGAGESTRRTAHCEPLQLVKGMSVGREPELCSILNGKNTVAPKSHTGSQRTGCGKNNNYN